MTLIIKGKLIIKDKIAFKYDFVTCKREMRVMKFFLAGIFLILFKREAK